MEADLKLTSAVFTGMIPGEKYNINKYFLENDKTGFALPVWVVKTPRTTGGKILVWLNSEGKDKLADRDLLNKFIDNGFTVVSADMPGTGELHDPGFKGDGFVKNVPFNYTFGAQLAGKSIPGIIADNIDLLMQFVKSINPDDNPVYAFIEKEMTSPLLHFTAVKDPFQNILFFRPLTSNRSLIEEKYYDPKQTFYVAPGSLPFYDVKEMLSLLPENSFKIVQPVEETDASHPQPLNENEVIDFFKE